MQLQTLKSLSEIPRINDTAEISAPTRCDPDYCSQLGTLIFTDNGALVFSGNCSLTVNNIYNYKNKTSLCDYEFIVAGKNGEDAQDGDESGEDAKDAGNLTLKAGWISGNIRIKAAAGSGGSGFDGVDGINGGNGGDGYCGGNGGDGGNAHAGTDGGNGVNAPNVDIKYSNIEKRSYICINDEKVKGPCEITLKGGIGGKGGRPAKGGKGGEGGKGIDPQHNGNRGRDGHDADGGKCGKNGADGIVKISRTPLEERLKDIRELYVFDLSDDEEREYCIKQLGGFDAVSKKEAVMGAIKKGQLKSSGEKKQPLSVTFNELTKVDCVKTKNSADGEEETEEDFCKLKLSFCVDLYDVKTAIADKTAASKWQFANVEINFTNTSYSTGLPVISQSYEINDGFGGVQVVYSEPFPSGYLDGEYRGEINIRGINADGEFVSAKQPIKSQKVGKKISYTVKNIEVYDPHWNKQYEDGIIMLYGRTDEQEIYKKADYKNGDYLNNTIKPHNKIATLMPFSGAVTFSDDYDMIGLMPTNQSIPFTRPTLDYDNKAAGDFDPNVVYQNDLQNNELYDLMKNCFTEHSKYTNQYVDFDFSMDRGDKTSKLDWHDDVSGEGDNHKRTVKLRGNFIYRLHRKEFPEDEYTDVQISVMSVTKKELEEISSKGEKREYYTFLNGSHVIYIPPIYIYWGCFGEDVMLKTADGSVKAARSIEVGDRLLTHSGEIVTTENIFKGNDKTIYRLKCTGGYETLLSGAHPVLCENGKGVPVRNLKEGDRVLTENGSAEVVSVTEEPYSGTVYNFAFEGKSESVYIIADGIYAGDFNAQNEAPEERHETEEEREERLILVEEMRSLCGRAAL